MHAQFEYSFALKQSNKKIPKDEVADESKQHFQWNTRDVEKIYSFKPRAIFDAILVVNSFLFY